MYARLHKISLTTILFLLAIFITTSIKAQNNFCATKAYRSPELIEFQLNGAQMPALRAGEMLNINTIAHIVGKDDGSGYIDGTIIFRQACELNEIYNKIGINFYISEIRFINNTRYYNHNNEDGYEMMVNYKVANRMNIFFVGDPAGACGYYMPMVDAVALKNSCLGSGSKTWPHEAGHFFSLPHTFNGWEDIDYDFTKTTPNRVNGILTEKVDGSNCNQAGDGFCDTTPDYLSDLWPCDQDTFSTIKQKDVNSEEFYSDGRNIMSYSIDACSSKFSEQQIAAMKYNIVTTRKWNTSEPNFPAITNHEIENFSPAQDEKVYFDNVTFSWDPVEGAIAYLLEYTPLPAFNNMSTKVLLTEPFYVPDTIYPFWTDIQWRVKPFGYTTFCDLEFSSTHNFKTMVTSIESANFSLDRSIFPNPASSGGSLNIKSENGFAGNVTIKVYNNTGALVLNEIRKNLHGNTTSIDLRDLHSGVHFVHIITNEGKSSHKILIMQ